MRPHSVRQSSRLIGGLLALLGAAAGCTYEAEQRLVPPRAPVSEVRTVAVAPFLNYTSDRGAAVEVAAGIADGLRASGWYEVVGPDTVGAYLTAEGIAIERLGSPETVQRVSAAIQADAVVVGNATYYLEDVSLDVPHNAADDPDLPPQWAARQYTVVVVQISARLVRGRDGEVLHAVQSKGEEQTLSTLFIPWREAAPPPYAAIPPPNRRYVPQTRETAIQEAVGAFLTDLLPRRESRNGR